MLCHSSLRDMCLLRVPLFLCSTYQCSRHALTSVPHATWGLGCFCWQWHLQRPCPGTHGSGWTLIHPWPRCEPPTLPLAPSQRAEQGELLWTPPAQWGGWSRRAVPSRCCQGCQGSWLTPIPGLPLTHIPAWKRACAFLFFPFFPPAKEVTPSDYITSSQLSAKQTNLTFT